MELILVLIGCIAFVIALGTIGGRKGGGKSPLAAWPPEKPPVALGLAADHPARSAAERLDAILGGDFEARVQYRVQAAKPSMTSGEWAWTWFELKRFFLMCALLRNVPMYSTKVDEAWHEMLMFTREYESFCQQFCGAYIHHAPHGQDDNKPEAGSRAWFDWVYAELFELSPASGRLWGSFFREPLSPGRLSMLGRMSEEDIRNEWFRSDTTARYDDLNNTAGRLIAAAKRQIEEVRKGGRGALERGKRNQSDSVYTEPYTLGMTGGGLLLYYSIIEPNMLEQRMNEHMPRDDDRHRDSSACSSYSGHHSARPDDSSHPGHSSHGGHASHDDGGTSSCGGGSSCGSGCGGGGD